MQDTAHELRSGFTQLPNALLDSPLFTALEKIVIWALVSFMWNNPGCWPSRKLLSQIARVSERTLVDTFASLREKKVVNYKRRGYGQTNYYHFLDPSIEAMIDRLMGEDRSSPPKTNAPTAPTEARAASAEPLRPLLDQAAAAPIPPLPLPAPAPAPAQLAKPADQPADQSKGTDQPQEKPVSPMGAIREPIARHCSEPIASHIEKKIQTEKDSSKEKTHRGAPARVCDPRSKFALATCITFAKVLPEIRNPYGYGTAIWQDGREDDRIEQFAATTQSPAIKTCGRPGCLDGVRVIWTAEEKRLEPCECQREL